MKSINSALRLVTYANRGPCDVTSVLYIKVWNETKWIQSLTRIRLLDRTTNSREGKKRNDWKEFRRSLGEWVSEWVSIADSLLYTHSSNVHVHTHTMTVKVDLFWLFKADKSVVAFSPYNLQNVCTWLTSIRQASWPQRYMDGCKNRVQRFHQLILFSLVVRLGYFLSNQAGYYTPVVNVNPAWSRLLFLLSFSLKSCLKLDGWQKQAAAFGIHGNIWHSCIKCLSSYRNL